MHAYQSARARAIYKNRILYGTVKKLKFRLSYGPSEFTLLP